MTIDNRAFLPFIMPFILLGTTRLMFWAAGAEWTEPEGAAVGCMLFGVLSGVAILGVLFDTGVSIGSITIGTKETDNG